MGQQHLYNYENFFTLHLDLLCILDKELRFIKLNEAWGKLLGCTTEELCTLTIGDFLHPEDFEKTYGLVSKLETIDNKAFNKINRLIDRNGGCHLLEWHCQLVGEYIYCSAKDITKFTLQEEEYQREQQRLKALVESQSNYLIRMDLDLRFTYANPKFIEHLGWFYNTTDLMGLPVFETDVVHYEDDMQYTVLNAVKNPGKTLQLEETIPTPEGDKIYILWQCICFADKEGKPWEIQCTGFDITERKQLELLELQEKEKILLETSTPITKLWEGILLLPIVGIIDTARVQILMKSILSNISQHQAKAFILDITSVPFMDLEAANLVIKIHRAVKLMGCECYICGISPAIAQTLISLDIVLENITSTASMKEALELALDKINLKVMSLKKLK